jgi:hypothetical protein
MDAYCRSYHIIDSSFRHIWRALSKWFETCPT